MRIIVTALATLSLAAFSLTSCATEPSPDAPPSLAGACRMDDARTLKGQALPSAEEIKARTGATAVRTAGPDDMLTQDFRADRITIIIDPATKKVLRANCG